ncbi:MAG TPA: ferredoxin, partial [Paludibacteraceae bacterium]|nr:ferredoxin [Paludibacteraceae bacterium]
MIINERNTRRERLMQAANAMMTAARTAPKGKGYDIIEIAVITDETIVELSNAMFEYSQQSGLKFITRDAENILKSEVILLIGTRQQNQNLNC